MLKSRPYKTCIFSLSKYRGVHRVYSVYPTESHMLTSLCIFAEKVFYFSAVPTLKTSKSWPLHPVIALTIYFIILFYFIFFFTFYGYKRALYLEEKKQNMFFHTTIAQKEYTFSVFERCFLSLWCSSSTRPNVYN